MAGVNRVVLIGNLTRDPELRYTSGAEPVPVCDMRLAVNGREKRDGQWVDRADFFDIRVWGSQGEACATHLARGAPCAIDGRLQMQEWKDKETGANRSRVIVIAASVQFLSRGGGGGGGGHESPPLPEEENVDFSSATGSNADFAHDEIPY